MGLKTCCATKKNPFTSELLGIWKLMDSLACSLITQISQRFFSFQIQKTGLDLATGDSPLHNCISFPDTAPPPQFQTLVCCLILWMQKITKNKTLIFLSWKEVCNVPWERGFTYLARMLNAGLTSRWYLSHILFSEYLKTPCLNPCSKKAEIQVLLVKSDPWILGKNFSIIFLQKCQ